MIKNIIPILFIIGLVWGQTYEDVVILKNGSEIHGIIIEQKPNDYIKIQSGKNTFVYRFDEIELMRKELVTETISNKINPINPKYWNKRHSIGIGIGTNKTFNIIQYTYDLKLSKSVSLYGLIGFGNLFGLGVAWQQNYNDNGLMLGWSGGIDVEGASFGSLALSYQWRLGQNHTFLSLGLASYAYEYESYSYYGGWETELIQMFVPVLSIDRRFGF